MRFESPLFLYAVPAVWLLVVLLAWRGRRYGTALLRFTGIVAKALALSLLLVALANPTVSAPTPIHERVVLVDRSASVSPAAWARFEQTIPESRTIHFTGSPDGVTDLAVQLHTAAALLPGSSGGRIVLATDGHTVDRTAAIAAAKATGAVIDLVPLEPLGEVALKSVAMPEPIVAGEPFDLTAQLAVAGRVQGVVQLTTATGTVLAKQPFDTARLQGQAIVLRDLRLNERDTALRLTLIETGPTDRTNNNSMIGHVAILPPRTVLVVSPNAERIAPVIAAIGLADTRLEITTTLPTGRPTATDDLLVCDESALSQLSANDTERLTDYLRDGGGLLVLAGGKAAPPAEPVAALLPVRFPEPVVAERPKPKPEPEPEPLFIPEEVTEKRHSVGLLILIDRSGSMAEEQSVNRRPVSMMAMAKASAIAAAQVLGDWDQIGVIAFSEKAEWVLSLTPARDKERIETYVSRLFPRGGTNLYPALKLARAALAQIHTNIKHVIVLSDGETEPRDFDTLVKQMVKEGITVSSVGIGLHHDTSRMFALARMGQGHYAMALDFTKIPQVVVNQAVLRIREEEAEEKKPSDRFQPKPKEATPSELPTVPLEVQPSSPPPAQPKQEQQELHTVSANPFTEGIDDTEWPPVAAYRISTAKPSSWVPLEVDDQAPALAAWRVGLGRVTVWTPDTVEAGSPVWPRWEKFQQLWAQLARATSRRTTGRATPVGFVSTALPEERFAGIDRTTCEALARATGGSVLSVRDAFEINDVAAGEVQKTVRTIPLAAAIILIPLELLTRRFRRRQTKSPETVPPKPTVMASP